MSGNLRELLDIQILLLAAPALAGVDFTAIAIPAYGFVVRFIHTPRGYIKLLSLNDFVL
jgi:hypothetical protein